MAEYAKESTQYITSDSDEDTPEGLLPDSLGLLVQERCICAWGRKIKKI